MAKRRDTQISGARGVFLAAAELAGRGFIVSLTSRSAAGADLLVTDTKCKRAYTVQVKAAKGNAKYWPVAKNAAQVKSPTHKYVFVNNLSKDKQDFYVVPSTTVARGVAVDKRPTSTWYSFTRDKKHLNNWKLFGTP